MTEVDNLNKQLDEVIAELDTYKDAVGRCYSDGTHFDNIIDNNPGKEDELDRLIEEINRLEWEIVEAAFG